MLPSMPILLMRESQDGFYGNAPSTSFFTQNSAPKPVINPEPPPKAESAISDVKKQTQDKKNQETEESKDKEDPLEAALIRSYYTRVQSRFSVNQFMPDNKFVQFQNILKIFDPSKETPVDLYKKIEKLFGVAHKDIVEDFLLFLKPGQAAEIGSFMDQFMLIQMTNFIEMLQNSFSRKPTVLRKVLRALTTGINSGNPAVMKTRVLPHLRSIPKLAQMFKSLFPDERPPDSVYENGVDMIKEEFLTNDQGYDEWEFNGSSDTKKKLDVKESLDTMYIHGRVFLQHRRTLRLARVTYPYSKEPYRVHMRRLTPTHCHLSPPDSDEERSSSKKTSITKIPPKRTRKQNKSPNKNVKDVNDNTKHKESVSSPKTGKAKKRKDKNESKTEVKRDKKDKTHTEQRNEGIKLKFSTVARMTKRVETTAETKRVEAKSNSWTRDEDKTMLQVLKFETTSEQIFAKIRDLLPHRSVNDIRERFYHVMTLLQQMAVDEVT